MTSGMEPVTIRLHLGGIVIGERRWPAVPAIGHRFRCRVAGVPVLAIVIEVVWGGSGESAIVDVFMRKVAEGGTART